MMWVFKTPASRLVRQASTFGIIPLVDHAPGDQVAAAVGSQTPDQAGGFILVHQNAGGIGQEYQLLGLDAPGRRPRRPCRH